MALSLRLSEDLEKEIASAALKLSLKKSQVIKQCIRRYLSEIGTLKQPSSYQLYQKISKKIPGSSHGSLSINHSSEVLKKLKKRHVYDSH